MSLFQLLLKALLIADQLFLTLKVRRLKLPLLDHILHNTIEIALLFQDIFLVSLGSGVMLQEFIKARRSKHWRQILFGQIFMASGFGLGRSVSVIPLQGTAASNRVRFPLRFPGLPLPGA